MNAETIEHILASIFEGEDLPEEIEQVQRIRTFENACLLTNDRGVVITADDGSEFQVTIIQSR